MSSSTDTRLFLGGRDDAAILSYGSGYLDDTVAFTSRLKSNRTAPAGAGGECLFLSMYLVVTYSAACVLTVTPYVDGVALEPHVLTFTAKTDRVTERHNIALSVPMKDPLGTEVVRTRPRGCWFNVLLEGAITSAGVFILDSFDLEREIMRESTTPE